MSREDRIELEGVVVDRAHSMFIVEVELGEGEQKVTNKVTCTIGGRLRQNYIRVLVGDRVQISVSPYDLTKGSITYRMK